MKNYFWCFLFIILFLIACGKAPAPLLLDSFEGPINAETVDFGSSEGSSLEVEALNSEKACGAQSLKIIYDLKLSGYMWIARGYGLDVEGASAWLIPPDKIEWNKYNALTISMLGMDSGAVIAFDIKDRGGELFRFLIDDDFKGWKEIICKFSAFFPRGDWQPENAEVNGVIDFPIMSFQFEPRMPQKGELIFDCVTLKKVK